MICGGAAGLTLICGGCTGLLLTPIVIGGVLGVPMCTVPVVRIASLFSEYSTAQDPRRIYGSSG